LMLGGVRTRTCDGEVVMLSSCTRIQGAKSVAAMSMYARMRMVQPMHSRTETGQIKSMPENLSHDELSKLSKFWSPKLSENVSKLESQYCEMAVKIWDKTGSEKLSKFRAKRCIKTG
jgi:hypothetical protein